MVVIEVVWEGFRSGVNVFVPTIFKPACVDSEVHGKYYIENEIHINEKIHINKPACVVSYFEIIKTS